MKLRLPFPSIIHFFLLFLFFCYSQNGIAQNKKMTPEVYKFWRTIDDVTISNNGLFVAYVLTQEAGDPVLKIYNTATGEDQSFERGSNPVFDYNNGFVYFKLFAAYDSIRIKKLKGVKKEKLPGDSLVILDLTNNSLTKTPNLKSFSAPEKWGDYVAVLLDDQDKKDKKSGSSLLFHNLIEGKTDTFPGVKEMAFPKENQGLVLSSSGKDSTVKNGLYYYDFQASAFKEFFISPGDFHQLSFSEDGQKFAFIADPDTTDHEIRPYTLYHSDFPDSPGIAVSEPHQDIPEGMQVSIHRKPEWSEDRNTLYFGVSPIPLEKDTTILDEEKPEVEVWTTDDPVLYTMQESRKNTDKKKNYLMALNLARANSGNKTIIALETEVADNVMLPDYGTPDMLLAVSDDAYQKEVTWLGYDYNDIYVVDAQSGTKKLAQKKINGSVNLSPAGKYAFWFDRTAQQYYTLDLITLRITESSKEIMTPLGDELNDSPREADDYGVAGWTENDQFLIVYDRYDLWKIDPDGKKPALKLTDGRNNKLVYRHISLDREADYIDLNQRMLLQIFDEENKYSGYAYLQPDLSMDKLFLEPYSYSRRIWKAEKADKVLFTKESMEVFPDLLISNTDFSEPKRITYANPQQSEYRWGTGKLFTWKDSMNRHMSGMVFTPDDFDPSKKYPLIVNFYERSSDGLYRYRGPYAGRSTISYAYYLNQGYVIFNPDIPYEIGYPGKSALNAVNSGLDALLEEGYIDQSRIGLQGHSWGGYQIAHILTKTNRFACAEAGAPVVNMTSAYGGIRWGTGMSRMFQYEKTQSRLGKTLWERPDLYLENSPLFETNKVETPVLIMHNDGDTAVPWYQGIEYYMALRRLGKKGWFLNYNGEPHWPVKWPNRLDFQTRMEQFFAHYLLDAPMPDWMEKGIPELEKGMMLGY